MNKQQSTLQPRFPRAVIIASAFVSLSAIISSCSSNEELEKKLDKRNDKYSSLQDRRQIRQDARQERTDAWFDRVMH